MKKIIKLLGVITFAVIIGLSMTSCDDEPGVGTIEVTNDSVMWFDVQVEGVTVQLWQGSKKVMEANGIQTTKTQGWTSNSNQTLKDLTFTSTKTKAVFKDIDEGDGYIIKVVDANTNTASNTFTSPGFSLSKDQVKKLSYVGDAVR
jgi:uncharacterized lipoprotein YehR (DUF1307 family)